MAVNVLRNSYNDYDSRKIKFYFTFFFILRYDVNIENFVLLFKVGLPFQMSG